MRSPDWQCVLCHEWFEWGETRALVALTETPETKVSVCASCVRERNLV